MEDGTKSGTQLVRDISLISETVPESPGRLVTLLLKHSEVYRKVTLKYILFKLTAYYSHVKYMYCT